MTSDKGLLNADLITNTKFFFVDWKVANNQHFIIIFSEKIVFSFDVYLADQVQLFINRKSSIFMPNKKVKNEIYEVSVFIC